MKLPKQIFFIVSALVFSSGAFAQSFEGTIYLEFNHTDQKVPITLSLKGVKSVMHVASPNMTMDIYNDRTTDKVTMVMLERKMGMTMSSKSEKEVHPATIVDGKQQKTINGHNCELYIVTSDNGSVSNIWLTSDLPASLLEAFKNIYINRSFSNNHQPGTISPAVEELFKKGLFPVQIETIRDGKSESTVTFVKYEERKLDNSLFEVPSDIHIMDMSSMHGMGK